MGLELHFDVENAAFDDDMCAVECARILRRVAQQVQDNQVAGVIRDVNGNNVGTWELEKAG